MKERHHSGFYLKPISRHFNAEKETAKIDEYASSGDSMSIDEILELRQRERKKLLALYGQSSERYNEIEHALYLKQQFISKTLPPDENDSCKILNMLLADRGILFTYGNDGYCNRQINRDIISEYRCLFRDRTVQEEFYQSIQAWKDVSTDSEKKICIELLKRITQTAAERHQNLETWVKRNISRDTPSIEERMSFVKLPPECQGEEKNNILEKIRPLITTIIPDSVCRQMLPDSPSYLKCEQNLSLFQEMLPEYSDKINVSFCHTFMNDVLPDYMQMVKWVKTLEYRPDHVQDLKTFDIAYEFICYTGRLLQLDFAQERFRQNSSAVLALDKMWAFGKRPVTGEISSNILQISNFVIEFFCKLNYPLRKDTGDFLIQRINWAMNVQFTKQSLRPVFILYMAVCCGRRLTLDMDIQIPEAAGPYYIKRIGWPKQRYEQLLLLNKLCAVFNVTNEERNQNLEQFLFWQGKNIESNDEYKFWVTQKEEFEFVPGAIDFQILCQKYLDECFPLYIDQLTYAPCSKLHLGKFRQFEEENYDKLYEQAADLEKTNPQLIGEYFKLWRDRDVKDYFFDSPAWLDNALERFNVNLSDFQETPDCDLQELRRLILEVEFRICISKKARRKLAKLLQKGYGLSPGLFKSVL